MGPRALTGNTPTVSEINTPTVSGIIYKTIITFTSCSYVETKLFIKTLCVYNNQALVPNFFNVGYVYDLSDNILF